MNYNPYDTYFYHGYSQTIYKVNYVSSSTSNFDYSSEDL